MKSIKSNITILFRFDYNINYLISFYFENDINRVSKYDDLKNCEYIFYISRLSKFEFYLQFNSKLKNITQDFVFEIDKKKYNIQLLKNPDLNNKYNINKQHFRIDFN